MRRVFVTGGTGYMGRGLIERLVARGHDVRALVRAASERKLPRGCIPVAGDALDAATFAGNVAPADTFVQLVGTAHPAPWKEKEFRAVDLRSALAGVAAAQRAGIGHFVYVSVAQPAPAMKAYIRVRAEVEAAIHMSGLNATILRPWYVLGPGHRWPVVLLPFYWLMEQIPATRAGARRLGLVTLEQMLTALVTTVETPVRGVHVLEVLEIRQAQLKA